jgi:hypothetical protein
MKKKSWCRLYFLVGQALGLRRPPRLPFEPNRYSIR